MGSQVRKTQLGSPDWGLTTLDVEKHLWGKQKTFAICQTRRIINETRPSTFAIPLAGPNFCMKASFLQEQQLRSSGTVSAQVRGAALGPLGPCVWGSGSSGSEPRSCRTPTSRGHPTRSSLGAHGDPRGPVHLLSPAPDCAAACPHGTGRSHCCYC